MVAVQAAGCAPMVRAFENGVEHAPRAADEAAESRRVVRQPLGTDEEQGDQADHQQLLEPQSHGRQRRSWIHAGGP